MMNKNNVVVFTQLQPKHGGQADGSFNARIEKGTIRIYGLYTNRIAGPMEFDKTFNVGDEAEYGSFNLIYTGKIVAIGPNTVTVERSNTGDKPKRMNIYEFVQRNWDFSMERIQKHNAEEFRSI